MKRLSKHFRRPGSVTWLALVLICLPVPHASSQDDDSDLASLRQQIAELSQLAVRTQSHVMIDVEYQFSNLWFAGQSGQWDLAAFYLRETRSHLGWTVRMRPVRNVAGGGTVDLQTFQQAIEQSGFTDLAHAIEQKDTDAFLAAYKETLPECHACHTASGLGYLEPHIPDHAPSPLMIQGQ